MCELVILDKAKAVSRTCSGRFARVDMANDDDVDVNLLFTAWHVGISFL